MVIRSRRRRRTITILVFIGFCFFTLTYLSRQLDAITNSDNKASRFVAPKKISPQTNRVDISRQSILEYLQDYESKIDGWLSREILYAIWLISQYQYDHLNIFGGIGEIGVHHGKFTCFLYLMRRYREQTLFAVDVFENQILNKDGSGRGNKQLFFNNIRKYANVKRNELLIYAGSSLDLSPVFSEDKDPVEWWLNEIVGERGLQLVSIDGGHTSILTYSDLCLISNSLMDGGVVTVDDITHPGWLGVRDGTLRFLSETSTLLTDFDLENELTIKPNETNFELSRRIIAATSLKPSDEHKSHCSRLVPFLQYCNKLFLTTPNYYPHYIELLGKGESFGNNARSKGITYLEYHALRVNIGSVPIWTDNHELNDTYKQDIFKTIIEPIWLEQI